MRRRLTRLSSLFVSLSLGAGLGAVAVPGVAAAIPADGPRPVPPPAFTVPAPVPPRVVVVAAGDSLSALASSVGVSCGALAAFNHVPDPDLILVGLRLVVPAASWRPPDPVSCALGGSGRRRAVPGLWRPSRTFSLPSGGFAACVISRESGGNPMARSPGGKYWGLYQFSYATWVANGGDPSSWGSASAAEQTAVFDRSAPSNWSPYDHC